MQQQLKIVSQYLLLLFLFLAMGGGSLYAHDTYEFREEQSFPSEKISAANLLSIAVRENPLQDISEFSKQAFFDASSVVPDFNGRASLLPTAGIFHFLRDLRRGLRIQLFPKHFFL